MDLGVMERRREQHGLADDEEMILWSTSGDGMKWKWKL